MIETDQAVCWVGAVVAQRGEQTIGSAEVVAVGGTGADLGLDHPQSDAADPGDVGAVGQQRKHRWAPGAGGTDQQLRPLSHDVCEQFVAVEGAVSQQEHVSEVKWLTSSWA